MILLTCRKVQDLGPEGPLAQGHDPVDHVAVVSGQEGGGVDLGVVGWQDSGKPGLEKIQQFSRKMKIV